MVTRPGFQTKAEHVEKLKLEGDEAIGRSILRRALEEPLRQIANNSGHEGAVVVEKVRQSTEATFGFNAETEKYEDLGAAGVIDPTMVTRTALQNAASIPALLLTTEALVSEIKEDNKAPATCLRAAEWATCAKTPSFRTPEEVPSPWLEDSS